jgi:hypothetical protein
MVSRESAPSESSAVACLGRRGLAGRKGYQVRDREPQTTARQREQFAKRRSALAVSRAEGIEFLPPTFRLENGKDKPNQITEQ